MGEDVREGEAVELEAWVEDAARRSVIGDGLECIWTIADIDDGELEDGRRCCGQGDDRG